MTWPYGVIVLDLEPRGPLPTEIYWRRRGLALGIAVVVVGIAVAIVIAFVDSSAGAKPVSADKPASAQSHPGSPAPQALADSVHGLSSSPQRPFLLGCVEVANPARVRPLASPTRPTRLLKA